jgi:hypothetical protein
MQARGAIWVVAIMVVAGIAGVSTYGLACSSSVEPEAQSTEFTGSSGSVLSGDDVLPVFSELATALAPMPVYAPPAAAPGVTVPADWWPVLELQAPDEYVGPAVKNPWVAEQPGGGEAQVILRVEEGWLVVLENFRGDLGEACGEPVGSVGGHAASLYSLAEGHLVQWSDGGRWYGVFGRGIDAERVVEMALSLEVVTGL